MAQKCYRESGTAKEGFLEAIPGLSPKTKSPPGEGMREGPAFAVVGSSSRMNSGGRVWTMWGATRIMKLEKDVGFWPQGS